MLDNSKLKLAEMSKISADDLAADPHKFGFISFAEFARDADKYREALSVDKMMENIVRGSNDLNNMIETLEYHVSGYRCRSAHDFIRMAGEMDIPVAMENIHIDLIPTSAGKCKAKVNLKIPDEKISPDPS